MKHGFLALLFGGLALVLLWVLPGILPPMAAADTARLQAYPAPASFAYLPYVVRQYPQLAPTPTATAQPTGLQPPVQVAPANGATLDTISPSFTIDNSALGRRAWADLQYAAVPDLASDVDGFRFAPFQGPNTAPLDWNLNEGTSYYWRVRSSLDGVNWGAWSGVWSFTTASVGVFPGTPALISPADQSTVSSLRPTLTWSPVTGATRYAISIDGFGFFSSSSAFTMYFDLDPGTAYGWSVSARNTYGWGIPSGEWAFTTPAQSITYVGSTGATGVFFELQEAMKTLCTVSD
jgi:hypothetical protein